VQARSNDEAPGAWGTKAEAVADLESLPRVRSATADVLKTFLQVLRKQLPVMVHSAVLDACALLHEKCASLAVALEGTAEAESLQQMKTAAEVWHLPLPACVLLCYLLGAFGIDPHRRFGACSLVHAV
jgi:hypothetical protein